MSRPAARKNPSMGRTSPNAGQRRARLDPADPALIIVESWNPQRRKWQFAYRQANNQL